MARTLGTTSDGRRKRDHELDVTAGGDGEPDPGSTRARFPPGTNIGRYVVLGEIGSGAMGVVLASFDPELNRKVALKLLIPTKDRRGNLPPAARLLREAQAIARLSHPNVVNVYDVGRHGEAVFLAMEFIDGTPLSEWLAVESRPLADVLAVFAHAGRGLAAAHAAGLVHRDFKPDNVLVTADGRVRVLDFGLARADPSRYSASYESDLLDREPGVPVPRVWSDSDVLNTSLTRDDAVVGTPRYMAPEQHCGDGADGQSDQFSFCVALFQALYGRDPFQGTSLRQLVQRKQDGQITPIPSGKNVPLWLEEATLRGLSADPDKRWPSMDALVAVLERDPAATRRRWFRYAGGATMLASLMAVVGYQQGTAERPCQGSEAHLAEVWNQTKKATVADSILATGVPYSVHTRGEVERELDEYAAEWIDAHRDACEATRVRGEQSEQLLDLRMVCLDRSKDAMRAFVDVLGLADASVVARAVQAATALPDLQRCGDIDRLQAQIAPPQDEQTRRLVETVEGKLAQARVLQTAGKTKDALELARSTLLEADAVGYAPLQAAALDRLGALLESTGDYAAAEANLRKAVFTALRVGDDERASSAATTLVSVVGDRLARHDEGLTWGEQASALLDRIGVDGLARSRLSNNIGNVLYRKGELSQARTHYVEALAVRERINGADDPGLGLELINLGNLQLAEDDFDGALQTFRRSQSIVEAALGAEHPNVTFAIVSVGVAFQNQGRHREARAQFERALPIMTRSLGDDHPFVATALLNLGDALRELGHHDEALTQLDRAGTIYRASLGADHPNVASVEMGRGLIARARDDLEGARRYLTAALRIRRANYGAEHAEVGDAILELARLDQLSGDPKAAVDGIREAIAIYDGLAAPARQRADAHAALADAMWDVGEAMVDARREAELALDLLRGLGPSVDPMRDELRDWLRDHDPDAAAAPAGRRTPPAPPEVVP